MHLTIQARSKEIIMVRSPQPHPKHEAPPLEFSAYSFGELAEIKKELDREIQSRQANEMDHFLARVAEAAHTLGVSIDKIFGLSSDRRRETRHARGKQPPKYRGPNGEEWSGKGPAPRWMKPFLAKGKTKADFLIK
jgi:DNA-binding protein H-NS